MSVAEIIEELPKLSLQERRQICDQLLNLEADHEDLQLCVEATEAIFLELDRQEESNAKL
ncbi:MAG: hypothetical protein AAF984_03415 [Verrucomicrobiota bacterium]